uniref:Lectin n=1 Tax=Artocarpus hypargyreus TaxID=1955528 RepID=A0A220QMD8_9ROSA|nr:lectin [Artocarpus hypargyreus]
MASKTIIVGPWGGSGGSAWDDGSYTGIREIELSYGDAIGTFNVSYDFNGTPFAGPKYPSKQFSSTTKIELDFPKEFFVSVNGYTDLYPPLGVKRPVIRSLTFKTNQGRTFGPYGEEVGTPFNLPIENGLFVGFTGRTGYILDAIGFHLAHN